MSEATLAAVVDSLHLNKSGTNSSKMLLNVHMREELRASPSI